MGDVVRLPVRPTVMDAWERYAALVRRANADRALWADRPYCEAMARAHRDWTRAWLRDGGGDGRGGDGAA